MFKQKLCVRLCVFVYVCTNVAPFSRNMREKQFFGVLGSSYGVATVNRIDKITGLFCKRDL